jgi:hypothetical protein
LVHRSWPTAGVAEVEQRDAEDSGLVGEVSLIPEPGNTTMPIGSTAKAGRCA